MMCPAKARSYPTCAQRIKLPHDLRRGLTRLDKTSISTWNLLDYTVPACLPPDLDDTAPKLAVELDSFWNPPGILLESSYPAQLHLT
jgi:hypothetical protein